MNIHYICFKDTFDNKLSVSLGGKNKVEYLIKKLSNYQIKTNVLSCAKSKNGTFNGSVEQVSDKCNIKFLPSKTFNTKIVLLNKILNKLTSISLKRKITKYINNEIKKDDIVIIYHSLYYIESIYNALLKKLSLNNIIVEVEEFYSANVLQYQKYEKIEINSLKKFNKFLFINELLPKYLDKTNENNFAISYGAYDIPDKKEKSPLVDNNYINIVYSGVVEFERKAALVSVLCAKYLNDKFKIHILGFGSEKNISKIKNIIAETNKEINSERVIFHDALLGDDYLSFLQSCDIGLSTHIYKEDELKSANCSFPNKILVYLSNGLHVVSTDLEVIKKSKIGNSVNYFNGNPEDLAKSIMSIDLNKEYDSTKILKELDKEFDKDFLRLITK